MTDATADVAVVGSGVCGVLVARELVRAGREVTMVERGAWKSHAEQLAEGSYERDVPTAAHNDEPHPGQEPYLFDYLYAVGGCSLHWVGVAPRLLPSDFEMRSRFGVARDWPLTYEQLVPFYEEAERALRVAGPLESPYELGEPYPYRAHPYSRVDKLIGPLLEPYFKLPQSRPTARVNGREPCCGAAHCELCPVDNRYSALHTLSDDGLQDASGFKLRERTIAASLRTAGSRVEAIECISGAGERFRLRPNAVVLAANGIENAAILLRSQFDDPDLGRELFDHEHRVLEIELDRPAGHGRAPSLTTGVSYAWADGDWRSERASTLVVPTNPGLPLAPVLADELAAGRRGEAARSAARARFEHTLVLDTLSDDLPRDDRRVELSPRRDRFGLPLNRISYPRGSSYVDAGRDFVDRDLARRLEPLGGRIVRSFLTSAGGHQLGTCRMGDGEGVVDPNQRHHRFDNLYVAGGSAFPAYGAHHPTTTIAALAIRLGRHIAAAHS